MVTFDFPAEGLIAIRLSTGAVREIITNQSHYNPAAMFVPAPPSNLINPVMDYFPSITYIKKSLQSTMMEITISDLSQVGASSSVVVDTTAAAVWNPNATIVGLMFKAPAGQPIPVSSLRMCV